MPTTDTSVSQVIVNKLTKAQYDSATKSATEFYAVTDVDGESYSTTEQKTGGTWVNGKPIYKKTVDVGTMPNNTRKQVAHGISNLDFIISMSGSAYGNGTYLPIPYTDTASANGLGLYASSTDLILFTSANLSYLTTSYVTIWYTKTTD